jgi:hypothetical protein
MTITFSYINQHTGQREHTQVFATRMECYKGTLHIVTLANKLVTYFSVCGLKFL